MAVSKDKYLILSLICTFLIIILSFIDFSETDENDLKIGMVIQVKETANGFVFDIVDETNTTYSCFFRERPETGSLYELEGPFSDSDTMVFIKYLKKCQTS